MSLQDDVISETSYCASGETEKPQEPQADDMIFEDEDGLLCADFDDDISVVSSEKSDYGSEEEFKVFQIDLRFKLSFESDRVYLYDDVSS